MVRLICSQVPFTKGELKATIAKLSKIPILTGQQEEGDVQLKVSDKIH